MTAALASRGRSRVASLSSRHPVASFVALTLALSWGYWGGLFAIAPEAGKLAIIPGGFGPPLAAATVTRLRGKSVSRWLRESLDPHVARRWYLVALGLPLGLGMTVGLVYVAVTGDLAADQLRRMATLYPLLLAFTMLLGGGQEELGWRGFALPALQSRTDGLTASVVIGLVWAVWHLPLFAYGVRGYAGRSILLYAGVTVGFSIVFTWLFNRTGGSVLLAIVLHGGINTATGLGGAFVSDPAATGIPIYLVVAVPVWVVALAVLVRHGRSLAAGRAATLTEVDAADAKRSEVAP